MAKNEREVATQEKEEAQVPEGVERIHNRKVYVPRTDIHETEEALVLTVDMPGVDEKHLDITLEKNVLTIQGHVEPEAPEGYSPAYVEYAVGDYERAFTISDEIDREKIDAAVKDGVLTLNLPKAGPSQKKIAVKSA